MKNKIKTLRTYRKTFKEKGAFTALFLFKLEDIYSMKLLSKFKWESINIKKYLGLETFITVCSQNTNKSRMHV